MKKLWFGGLVVSSLLALACSSGPNNTGGSGGSGNNGGGGSGNNGGGGNNNGGGGNNNGGGGMMGTDCATLFANGSPGQTCTDCLVDNCCDEVADCDADPDCGACFDGNDATVCDPNNVAANALVTCVNGSQGQPSACAQQCQWPICMSGLALPLAQGECAQCLDMNCCTEYTTCAGDMQCLQCITGQLMDPATCDANANLTATGTCRETSCSDVCATEICNSGLVHPVPACGNCLETNCCNQFTACAADTTCLDCITGKTDPMSATCTGSALFTAASMCQSTSCANDC